MRAHVRRVYMVAVGSSLLWCQCTVCYLFSAIVDGASVTPTNWLIFNSGINITGEASENGQPLLMSMWSARQRVQYVYRHSPSITRSTLGTGEPERDGIGSARRVALKRNRCRSTASSRSMYALVCRDTRQYQPCLCFCVLRSVVLVGGTAGIPIPPTDDTHESRTGMSQHMDQSNSVEAHEEKLRSFLQEGLPAGVFLLSH